MDGSGVLKGLLEAVNSPRASEGSRVENYGQAAFANVARCHDILYIYTHTGVARDSAKRMHTPAWPERTLARREKGIWMLRTTSEVRCLRTAAKAAGLAATCIACSSSDINHRTERSRGELESSRFFISHTLIYVCCSMPPSRPFHRKRGAIG